MNDQGLKRAQSLCRTPLSLFGPDDFVFLDGKFDPYFVHEIAEPKAWWIYYWHEHQRGWVSLGVINEAERETFRQRSLTRIVAELYFAPTNERPSD